MSVTLDQPVELVVRGDRQDIVGLLAAVNVLLEDHADVVDGDVPSRAQDTIDRIMRQVRKEENIELVRRELGKAVRDGNTVDYRGVNVLYGEFDPRHPEVPDGVEVEREDLEASDAYVILGKTSEGMYGEMWPHEADVELGLTMASWLRTSAREIEDSVLGEFAVDERGEPS